MAEIKKINGNTLCDEVARTAADAAQETAEEAKATAAVQADMNCNDPDDPAYIKNRTHYTILHENEVLVENATVVVEEGSVWAEDDSITVDLVEGDMYDVTLNGETYRCECNVFDGGYLYIGSHDLWMDNEVEEYDMPFCYGCYKGQTHWFGASTPGTYTVGITRTRKEVKQLDEKYLPDISSDYTINDSDSIKYINGRIGYYRSDDELDMLAYVTSECFHLYEDIEYQYDMYKIAGAPYTTDEWSGTYITKTSSGGNEDEGELERDWYCIEMNGEGPVYVVGTKNHLGNSICVVPNDCYFATGKDDNGDRVLEKLSRGAYLMYLRQPGEETPETYYSVTLPAKKMIPGDLVDLTPGTGITIEDGVIAADTDVLATKEDIPTYTAGNGISIEDGVIAVDESVVKAEDISTEEWTFTLDNESTVTKKVVLM